MASYPNGRFPEHLFLVLGEGYDKYGKWQWLAPPGTAARWAWMVKEGQRRHGVTLRPTAGYSFYRPYYFQELYKKEHGKWAAAPGYSSHGGVYGGQDSIAIDVNNWAELGTEKFFALARDAGFRTNFVSPYEPWHIGDFNPWTVPAGMDPSPFEEDDMNPAQDAKLDAVYKALFGPNNGPAKTTSPLGWRNHDGSAQKANYGVLPIVIHNQTLIAKQGGRLAAIEEVVEQLAGSAGAVLDMAAIEAAAERGAREALGDLQITISTGE